MSQYINNNKQRTYITTLYRFSFFYVFFSFLNKAFLFLCCYGHPM